MTAVKLPNQSAPTEPPPSSLLDSYFTVYKTDKSIEIHPGCEDHEQMRVICTCVEYSQACEIAKLVANLHRLPIQDLVT
jgi:hypothetical protein